MSSLMTLMKKLLNKKTIFVLIGITVLILGYKLMPRKGLTGTIELVEKGAVETIYSNRGKMMSSIYFRPNFPKTARVKGLKVKVGDIVKKGLPLIKLESKAFDEYFKVEKKQYSFQQEDLKSKIASNELNERLYNKKAISREEYTYQQRSYFDYIENTWKKNKSDWQAKLDIKNLMNYKSNYNGYVSKVYVNKNENIPAESFLFEIINRDDVYIWLNIDNAYDKKIVEGMPARIEVKKNIEISGKIIYVSPLTSKKTFMIKIKVPREGLEFFDADKNFKVRIAVENKDDVIRVPNGALRYYKDKLFVYKLSPANRVIRQIIDKGIIGDKYTEVLEGLTVNDRVVTYPYKLEVGQRVKKEQNLDNEEGMVNEAIY